MFQVCPDGPVIGPVTSNFVPPPGIGTGGVAVSKFSVRLAVAALPTLVGLGAQDYADAEALTADYRAAMLVCAGLLVAGGLSALAVPRRYADCAPPVPATAPGAGTDGDPDGTASTSRTDPVPG